MTSDITKMGEGEDRGHTHLRPGSPFPVMLPPNQEASWGWPQVGAKDTSSSCECTIWPAGWVLPVYETRTGGALEGILKNKEQKQQSGGDSGETGLATAETEDWLPGTQGKGAEGEQKGSRGSGWQGWSLGSTSLELT